jgi:phosphatidylethanolamine/phosphatidyl-N-methylethanolamine N-methyltransferase
MSEAYEVAGPRAALDADAVKAAYRRWASVYDTVFGAISAPARREAVAAVNRAPGNRVLEVGVGTGLALPFYSPEKRITGIDLSAEMLALARKRVRRGKLANVEALLELDAEQTGFDAGQFDIAVAMFVASVVPHPRALASELARVVRPGGTILFVNHFAAESGMISWVERIMAPGSRALGWHPDFKIDQLLAPSAMMSNEAMVTVRSMKPLGLFRLVTCVNA